MTRNIAVALATLPFLLSACGTPQEQCIRKNTRELRVVSNLLAEVEGNLARGYAWDEREVTHTVWRDCDYVARDKDGNKVLRSRPCLDDVTSTERFRVPIDPMVETRKRDNLAAKRATLTRQAEEAVRACKAAYPDEG